MNAVELLPLIRDLFSRRPEVLTLEPWHLAWVLFALRCSGERWDPEIQNKRRFVTLSYRNVGNVGNGGAA